MFEKHIKDLPAVMAKLKTVEDILYQPRDIDLWRVLCQLNCCIHDELKAIQVVFEAWTFHLQQGFSGTVSNYREITKMERKNASFLDSVVKHKKNIAALSAEKWISRSKTKIVRSKQKQENMNGTAGITQARITTEQEVLQELERLGIILAAIEKFSTELGRALRSPGSTIASTTKSVGQSKDAYSVKAELAQRVLSNLNFQIAGLANAIELNP